MRKTKIICTIGPASENAETLKKMCQAGMNVARLNFSHGTHEEQQKKIDLIKQVRQELGLPLAIMLDTKGPEYRIRTFKDGKVTVAAGDTFTFTVDEVEGDETRVSVNYKGLVKDLSVGDRILVNNGLVIFEVKKLQGSDAVCKCVVGGELSNRKSMSFPNKVMTGPFLSEADKADLLFGIRNDVDFVAASFVSNKQNVLDIRSFLDENGVPGIAQRTSIICPQSFMGPVDETERRNLMARDGMGRYDEAVDNISAYEVLTDTIEHEAKAQQLAAERAQLEKDKEALAKQQAKLQESAVKQKQKEWEAAQKKKEKAAERRQAQIERQLINTGAQVIKRGILSTLFGK